MEFKRNELHELLWAQVGRLDPELIKSNSQSQLIFGNVEKKFMG